MTDYAYLGSELDLFARALHWKSYWRSQLSPFIRGAVLEVGAGNGNNTRFLEDVPCTRWVAVEPDAALCAQLRTGLRPGTRTEVMVGALDGLPESERFDAILYLDVLEHIEDDRAELRRAAGHLSPGGHLIVLAPAHQRLYSPFDRAIGHFRRYDRGSLSAAAPAGLAPVLLRYLDSAGLLASLANRLLLKQAMPTAKQLRVWDQRLVPISQRIDPLFGYRLGKSVAGVWRNAP